eukprot:sb/3478730/
MIRKEIESCYNLRNSLVGIGFWNWNKSIHHVIFPQPPATSRKSPNYSHLPAFFRNSPRFSATTRIFPQLLASFRIFPQLLASFRTSTRFQATIFHTLP